MTQPEGSIFDTHKTCGASAQEAKEGGVRAQGHGGGGGASWGQQANSVTGTAVTYGGGGGGGGRQILTTSSKLNSIDVISNGEGGTLPVDPS